MDPVSRSSAINIYIVVSFCFGSVCWSLKRSVGCNRIQQFLFLNLITKEKKITQFWKTFKWNFKLLWPIQSSLLYTIIYRLEHILFNQEKKTIKISPLRDTKLSASMCIHKTKKKISWKISRLLCWLVTLQIARKAQWVVCRLCFFCAG